MQAFFDFIWDICEYFVFWTVIYEYEVGIKFRLGKYKKTLDPGLHFHWPLGIDSIDTENATVGTEPLDTQTVDTFDNISLVVSATVTWAVEDIELLHLKADDHEGLLIDKVGTWIAYEITQTNYDDIFLPEFWNKVTIKARRDLKKFGMRIDSVKYTDLAKIRTIRLIQE